MVNFETLPRCISFNGNHYTLNVHITAWNKICVSYQLLEAPTIENGMFYNIFSQVVEPNLENINYSSNPLNIVDVPSFEMGVNVLSARVNKAIEENKIEIIH